MLFSWPSQRVQTRRTSLHWKRGHFLDKFYWGFFRLFRQWYYLLNVLEIESASIAVPAVSLVPGICGFSNWDDSSTVLWSVQDSLYSGLCLCFVRVTSNYRNGCLVFSSVVLCTGIIHHWRAILGFALSHEISRCYNHEKDHSLHLISGHCHGHCKPFKVRHGQHKAIFIL